MTLKNYPDEDLADLSIKVLVYNEKSADKMREFVEGIIQPTRLDGKTELEPIVDRDIAQFDEFYQRALNNTKLTNYERAAIKTYLHWKLLPPTK